MSAHKLITGQDAPLSNIEMVLTGTYQKAITRFEEQERKARGNGRRR